jgi:uncharacterized repeat protein (TIGR03803 family)
MSSRLFLRVVLAILAVVFLRLGAAAATEKVVHSFNPFPHGYYPNALAADGAGNFYGTAAGGGPYGTGVLYKFSPDSHGGWTQTVLLNFKGGTSGSAPGVLVRDATGNLYGATFDGGTGTCLGGCGAVVKLARNAHGIWRETLLYSFPSTGDLEIPTGDLVMDKAGNLYGTTSNYGGSGTGIVFEISPASGGGWTETVLHSFPGGTAGGFANGLVLDQLGNLYGTTETGGTTCGGDCGTVFELSPSSGGTWTYSVLYNFNGGSDGATPTSLIFDSAGNLYGTTFNGGNVGCNPVGCGTVFELIPGNGGQWTETILYSFSNPQRISVGASGLVLDSQGNLYGTTYEGGTNSFCPNGCGTVYEVSPSGNGQWTGTVLYNFTGYSDGRNPNSGLVLSGGRAFGTTTYGVSVSGTIFSIPIPKGKLVTLYAFPPSSDGIAPYTGLVADASGNLYGTTATGGSSNIGAVYEMMPTLQGGWTEALIYSFPTGRGSDPYGEDPSAVTLDGTGNLFGTTLHGGDYGYGLVFELSPSSGGGWTEATLHSFTGFDDGKWPQPASGLIFDGSGNLYGTTNAGGTKNKGAVFEMTPGANGQWTETVIHNFGSFGNDGAYPEGGLIMDKAGNIYGTTREGGNTTNGTVFKLSPSGSGWQETVLYSFHGSGDGANPGASLVLDTAGNLYGTTQQGGIKATCRCGTVFELSPSGGSWTETTLHQFADSIQGGVRPLGGLAFDAAGNLYGTTAEGGIYGHGSIFKLTPGAGGSWTYAVVHNFGKGHDGQYPASTLLLNAMGTFYGTTVGGGDEASFSYNGYGTVFEFTP